MKKQILKIFLVMLIFLMGIGAVNAIDNNFTEDLMSFEQSEIGYNNETIEVLSVEN